MNTTNSEKQWLQYFHDAANIRLNIEIIKDDIEFEKSGGRIIYAIDTNVIFLYAEPLRNKVHATTFIDENDKVLQGTVISLANFIFFNGLVSKENDYLLLPTQLKEEFIGCCCKIYDNFVNEDSDAINPTLIERIETLIKQINDNSDNGLLKKNLLSILVNDCPNLVRYLNNEDLTTAKSAIDRLAKLNDHKRVCSIETDALLGDYNPDFKQVKEVAGKLEETLKDIKKQHRKFLINNDANALAQIALINYSLIEAKQKIRLYYITSDEYIYGLYKYDTFNNTVLMNGLASSFSIKDLPYNFIRHPAQYVNCIRFTRDSTLEEKLKMLNKIQKPIDEFLKLFSEIDATSGTESQYLKNLRTLVDENPASEERPMTQKVIDAFKTIDPFAHKYEDLKNQRMELLALRNMSKALDIPEIAEGLAHRLYEVGINELLDERRTETYEKVTKMSLTFGVIGFTADYLEHIQKFNVAVKVGNTPRGPVSLKRSLDLKGGEAFFEKVHRLVGDRKWSELFQLVNPETDYIKHLIYALLAADAGQWHRARVCSWDAINASEDESKSNEAYYLYAVALRHDCRNVDDYNEAFKMREKGLAIWKGRPEYEGCDDLRFESERLALATAYFNYKRFMNRWEAVKNEPSIKQTFIDLHELTRKIINFDESRIIRARIERQAYTNLCCLFIFDLQFSTDRVISDKEGYDDFIALKRLTEKKQPNNEKFRTSYLINFLLAFLDWHFKSDKEKLVAWIDAFDKANEAATKFTIPYEQEKFAYFRSFLIGHQRDQ